MEVAEPGVLARLPKPMLENSQHKYGHAYGLSAGRKRKRHEVAVAIDGVSVNIYEVEHGSIKASYAIPPATSFVCSPTSLRIKTGRRAHKRFTYCATRRQGQQRLECFEERFDDDRSEGVTTSNAVVAEHDGDVEHLGILPRPGKITAGTNQHSVFALYKTGVLRLFAPSLQQETALRLSELHSTGHCHEILTAQWLSFEDVQKSTLKHRPDLLASADPTSSFVSVLYRQKVDREFIVYVSMWSVPAAAPSSSGSHTNEITAIATYQLPHVQLWSQEANLECRFNPNATALLVTGVKGVANYDFSSYSPRLTWEHQSSDQGLSSAQINSSLIATSSTKALAVHDIKYSSLQAKMDLTRIGNKRRLGGNGEAMRGIVRIIGYFHELGRLVTLRRNHLLSFELRGAPKKTMLIDSIGCGATRLPEAKQSTDIKLQIGVPDNTESLHSKQWKMLQQEMTLAAGAKDAARFEAAALKVLHDLDSQNLLSDRQTEFLLSRIFGRTGDVDASRETQFHGQDRLHVAMPVPKALFLLIKLGVVTRYTVRNALRSMPQTDKATHVEAGTVPAALIESDGTLLLLESFLNNAEIIDAKELAATVSLLVNLVLSKSYAETSIALSGPQLLIPQSFETDNPMETDNRPDTSRSHTKLMTEDTSSAGAPEQVSVLRVLMVALEKFARFGTTVVADELRTSLKRTEIVSLIQILRQQLFEGQYTTSIVQGFYPSPPSSANSTLEGTEPESALSLDATLKILLGCIDVIGSLGFLAEADEDDFFARVIPELRSETALATQGLEEASYLRGILRETMRYAESVDKKSYSKSIVALTGEALLAVQKPGTIITLYSEPTIDQGDVEIGGNMLPLSLCAENALPLTKRRKGGGQVKERSLRDLREMQNRNKGIYSFERLVL